MWITDTGNETRELFYFHTFIWNLTLTMLKSNGTCQKMTTLWLVPSMSYDMAPALPVKVPVNRDKHDTLCQIRPL